jgi:hypothetical protein
MSTAGKQTWPQEIQYCSEVRRESVPTKQGNKPRRRRKKKRYRIQRIQRTVQTQLSQKRNSQDN